MGSTQQWLTRLKNELSDSPLVSNVAFGFILMGLEKLVELEFECPCDPMWNGLFSSAFFIIPAVMALAIMMIVQGCRCEVSRRRSVSLSSVVPAVVWLILLFLDGQYLACAMTDWHGRYVIVDKAAPQKWCEPTQDQESVSPRDLMLRSQRLFVESQVIGIVLLIFICFGLVVYVIRESCQQELETPEVNVAEMSLYSAS
ncbi:calcium homeostasis modulator protein 4 [Triplophysa dalaica]|uniref:calcium homeostasis modulator protein 4 n=1 Tax=Triplophysa dalaica TaxID=1582913 RepID=UPI0024DFEC50|nr:calcium homeostasis modulator protein 4 [Triplophysa dalaica]